MMDIRLLKQTMFLLLFLSVIGCSQSDIPLILENEYIFINLDNKQSKISQSNDTLFKYYSLDSNLHKNSYKIIGFEILENYTFLKLEYINTIPENGFCPGSYSIKALKTKNNNKQLSFYDYNYECLTKYQLDSIVIDTLILKGKTHLTYFSDTYLQELTELKRIAAIEDLKKVINSIEGNDFNSNRIMYSAEQLNLACIDNGYNPIGAALIIDSISRTRTTEHSIPPPPVPPNFSHMYWDTLILDYFSNSQIRTDYNEEFELYSDTISEGDKIVFEFNKIHDEYFRTSDNHYERVVFEIDTAVNEFEFKDKELLFIKCIMDIGCHDDWWEYQDYSVSNGIVSGKKKQNGEWKIIVDINNGKIDSKYFYEVQFEETFTNEIKER